MDHISFPNQDVSLVSDLSDVDDVCTNNAALNLNVHVNDEPFHFTPTLDLSYPSSTEAQYDSRCPRTMLDTVTDGMDRLRLASSPVTQISKPILSDSTSLRAAYFGSRGGLGFLPLDLNNEPSIHSYTMKKHVSNSFGLISRTNQPTPSIDLVTEQAVDDQRDCTDNLPVPRQYPFKSNSLSSSLSLSTMDDNGNYDEPCSQFLALDVPKMGTSRRLIEDINRLQERLDGRSCDPAERALREANRLVKEACSRPTASIQCTNNSSATTHPAADELLLNPGLTVNIPEQVCTFNNLMELSVDESEIVRQERERIAVQRKRMAKMRKRAAKERPPSPPPDVLEFFDPNRHIFQSVNLHLRGMPNMKPQLRRGPQELISIFHERLLRYY